MTYKVYVYDEKKAWTLLAQLKDKKLAEEYVDLLSPLYEEIIVIRHDKSHNYDEAYIISNKSAKKDNVTKERDIYKNFEPSFYKIYGSTDKGWNYLAILYETLDIEPFINQLDTKIYNSCMVIHYNPIMKSDELFQLEFLNENKNLTRKKDKLDE